ncbi:MAG: aldehyde-activating protein [Myxococcaceae bacterium]|nr:aldehyde-activating protein [Myxococcaceae bacterium]
MTEAKAYTGSCHCGNVRYQVTLDLTAEMLTCNCSICARTGTMLTFVPAAAFTLERGEDALTDYQFGKKHIHHNFCSTCGVRSFAWGNGPDGSKMYAINARCLEDVDLHALKTKEIDGKSK